MATYLGEKLHTNVQLPAILPGARGAALLWQGAAAATGLGLGAGQPKLLNYLSVHGSCMQKELAEIKRTKLSTRDTMVAR